jgi:hypothetical protein
MACGTLLGSDFSGLGPLEDGGPPFDGNSVSVEDSGSFADGESDGGPDGAPALVQGGIFSVGNDPGTGSASLPDGATATLLDQGFELGGATCDSSGAICVTGAITP